MTKIEMFLDQLSRYDDFVEARRNEIESQKELDNILFFYGLGLNDALVEIWKMAFDCGFASKECVDETD